MYCGTSILVERADAAAVTLCTKEFPLRLLQWSKKTWCHDEFQRLLKSNFWQPCHASRGMLDWMKCYSICLVQIPCNKDVIMTPGCCWHSSLPPTIMTLFTSCTDPTSNLNPHLSQSEAILPHCLPSLHPSCQEFQCNPIWDQLSHHIWLTSIGYRFLLKRGWGKLVAAGVGQETTWPKSKKEKGQDYNFWETGPKKLRPFLVQK